MWNRRAGCSGERRHHRDSSPAFGARSYDGPRLPCRRIRECRTAPVVPCVTCLQRIDRALRNRVPVLAYRNYEVVMKGALPEIEPWYAPSLAHPAMLDELRNQKLTRTTAVIVDGQRGLSNLAQHAVEIEGQFIDRRRGVAPFTYREPVYPKTHGRMIPARKVTSPATSELQGASHAPQR